MSFDARIAFGELRSLLDARGVDERARHIALDALVQQAYREVPSIFIEQWLPYIEGFATKLDRPLRLELGSLEEFESAPALSSPRALGWHLNLNYRVGVEVFHHEFAEAIAALPQLVDVKGIELTGHKIQDDGLAVILESPNLGALAHLKVGGNQLTRRAARKLAGCERLQSLTLLDLRSNAIGDEGITALVESKHLGALTYLQLGETRMKRDGIDALHESDLPGRLTHLGLGWNSPGVTNLHRFLQNENLTDITHLDLAHTRVGDIGAEILAYSENQHRLECLYLGGSSVHMTGAKELATSARFRDLRVLDLSSNGITDKIFSLLDQGHEFEQLRILDLRFNRITEQVARAFEESGALPSIEKIILGKQVNVWGAKEQHGW